jgi:hypothetical protein
VSEATPPSDATFSGLLYHPTRHSVLMRQGVGGWELPWVRLAWPNPDRRDLGTASARLSEVLGIRVFALRYVAYDQQDDPASNRPVVAGVYALESLEPLDDARCRGTWIHRDALAALPLTCPDHRAQIAGFFEDMAGRTPPPFRQPWSEPGWFGRATDWIQQQLSARGYRLISDVVQVQGGSISCVLKCPTNRGTVFFKATGYFPTFVDEPSVQAVLAGWYPELVAPPIAIDSSRRWMLNVDVGESLWSQGNSLDLRVELLATYGKLQVDSVGRLGDLLAIGCIDRRLNRLVEQIEPLIADPLAIAHLDAVTYDRLHR